MTRLLLTPRPDCRLTRVRKACTIGSSWTCDISRLCHSGTAREKGEFAPWRKMNLEVIHFHYISEGVETLVMVLYLTLTAVPMSRFRCHLLTTQKTWKSVGIKSLALYHWPESTRQTGAKSRPSCPQSLANNYYTSVSLWQTLPEARLLFSPILHY